MKLVVALALPAAALRPVKVTMSAAQNRRAFVIGGTAAAAAAATKANAYSLPDLPYAYDALEPSFDAILPVGDAGNGHALVVGVSVKDALEAVARATTQAHVRPATFSKRAESKRESDGDAARWIRDDDTAALDVADDDGGSDDELLDPPDIPRSPPGSQGPAAFCPDDDDDVSVVLEK